MGRPTMPFRLAHLSDCHLGPLPPFARRELVSKRLFGYLNWQRNRAKAFAPGTTQDLLEDLAQQGADHIAVTGDLVNIALESEFESAARFLAALGSPDDVTAIPGNHDAYVPGALARFNAHMGPFIASDAANAPPASPYPLIRRRGSVLLLGLSSATVSGPMLATGAVDKGQRERMLAELSAANTLFRVVLIHHPPTPNATRWHKRLIGAQRLRAIWRQTGCELILHGHTHLPTRASLAGPDGPIAVFGVASAAQAPGGHKPAASYTLFDIEESVDSWLVTATRRGYGQIGQPITQLSRDTFIAYKHQGATASQA
jgi:3',5'-cyclic AMP phosphodiesterase CpdA